MIRSSTMIGRKAAWAACLIVGVGAAASADTVTPNNPGGDFFTVPGAREGQQLGSSNWYYNSVGGGATVGINNTYPHGGDGSVYFHTVDGNSKADIEYLVNPTQAGPNGVYSDGQPLGALSDLTAFSYEWYRDSASTNSGVQVPSLRLQVTNGVNTGYLVFEPTYSQFVGDLPTDTWVTSDLFANPNLTLWSNGTLPDQNLYNITLSDWMTTLAGYDVIGISSGVGSGWAGSFTGAVDNITFGFNGVNTTTTFEVSPAVPEPASVVSVLTACGMGLAAAAYRRRRAR
jgi:hypothetical protein